jgi:small-conductance mechanosensitive channel
MNPATAQAVGGYWESTVGAVEALPPLQGFAVVLVASVLLAKLIQVGGDRVVRRLTARIDGEVDDIVFETLHPPLYASVLLVGGVVAVELLDLAIVSSLQVRPAVFSVLVVVWVLTLTRLGRKLSAALKDDGRSGQVVPIFQNVWTAVVVGAGGFLLLSFWNVDVTPLLASAGIIGIVLGFAARDTIANFFGSIALYADGTYKVGDYIVLETGERGRVEDITIRSTTIRTRDDMLVTVPNAVLNAARIINESTPQTERRVRIEVGVAYGTDIDHVEAVLLGVAGDESLVRDDPAPRVRMRGFGDSAIDLELLCWIGAPVLRGRASHKLYTEVYRRFTAEGIEIPFPQRVVTMGDGDGSAGAVDPAPEAERAADDD